MTLAGSRDRTLGVGLCALAPQVDRVIAELGDRLDDVLLRNLGHAGWSTERRGKWARQ